MASKSVFTQQSPSFTTDFSSRQGGLNEAMIHQIAEALEKRELIKILVAKLPMKSFERRGQCLTYDEINLNRANHRRSSLFKLSSKEKYQKISPEVKGI